MYLAFSKPSGDKASTANGVFFDKLICWRTHSPFCHVELVFGEPSRASTCFSSSPADGGVRYKAVDLTTPNWVLVPVPGDDKMADRIATQYLGEDYDWAGIFGFVLPFGEHNDNDKFCSEVCAMVLQRMGILPPDLKTWEVSPGDLYNLVIKKEEKVT